MSLFDGLLIADPIYAPPISSERPYLVTIKQASNGAKILLCNVSPPPAGAIAEARSRKLALFTLDEIPAMRRAGAADPRFIDNLVATRRITGWGGPITFTEAA